MLELLNLLAVAPEDSLLYAGHYDVLLVLSSVALAIFASYASLQVSLQVNAAPNPTMRHVWTALGGFCMGIGIWAMHFVGMLAFSLPCVTSYDTRITFLSTIPGILASTLAIKIISRGELTRRGMVTGGVLIGAGIGAMHYSGMAAMHLNGLIRYDIKLYLLSILVAVGLATFALWIKFRLQSLQSRWISSATLPSAIVMGLAVSGMHYTAMAATYFIRDSETAVITSSVAPAFLAAIIGMATGLIVVATIVATFVGDRNLRSVGRSSRLIGALVVGGVIIAWLSADYYHDSRVNRAYQQEAQLARDQLDEIVHSMDEDIALLRGVSQMLSVNAETLAALGRFNAHVETADLPYEARKRRWTQDKVLGEVGSSLGIIAAHLKANEIFILSAAGDCIAASNVGSTNSFVGTNLADRDYFLQARAGQPGHQYAVGRVSKIPGLYYSSPVVKQGRFIGVVVVKRDLGSFSYWTKQSHAFAADMNGVVILAADRHLEFRLMPNASAARLASATRDLQYGHRLLTPLDISPWQPGRFPAAVLIDGTDAPAILVSRRLPEDSITVYVPRPLGDMTHLATERHWLFALLAAAGSMLIFAASAIVLYLRESKAVAADLRIAATAFESQEGMTITDAAGIILRVNQAFTRITGYPADEVLGRNPHVLRSGRHDTAFYQAMWQSLADTGAWQGEIWNRRKSGEVYPEWLLITAVKDSEGNVTHYVGIFSDITARKKSEDEINSLVFFDPLTRLPNRRLLLDRLKQALASSMRSERYGALLFIDLDNFKTLNDTLGHDVGDMLLQQVAQRLVTCVREGDTVARLGGDEFVVMLEDLNVNMRDSVDQAKVVGEKIIAALNQHYQLATSDYHITPSIGITLFANRHESIDELLKQADLAMYQAKDAGRNTLRFFDPEMQSVVTTRASMEADMRASVFEEQFVLYYQPQVIGDGRLTGAEVLLRWPHPTRGMVSPADFIPLAEETGLILPLGHWVLQSACAQLAKWATQRDMNQLTIAVNVSARQFRLPNFVEEVLAILAHNGANPHRLKLELTESLLVDDVEDVIAKMTSLKSRGVGFSLDDFGTGYSSLAYLKRLPLDQLKIDQGFVRNILTDPNDAAIAKMVVALAESMGLTVIAEGVEMEAQRDFLARHGCHAYQGYLFSRPLPLDEFEVLAKRG